MAFSASAFAQHEGHAGMDHSQMGHAMPAAEQAQPAQPSPLPPPTAEERAAAFPDLHGMDMRDHMDDDPLIGSLQFDQLEWQDPADGSGDAGLTWNLRGWLGGVNDRAWLRSEGERRDGRTEHGDVELLWGHATGPWWDRVVGLRHDFGEGRPRDWLAIGVQGLAPYKFEVAATAYVGESGRLAARVEAEYELLLTNRLILQPKVEADLYSKDDPENGIGRGLSSAEFGLRLRYEFRREFAPYLGYVWTRRFGETADLAQVAGGERSEGQWVAGFRFWF
ncbi:MAG TPA: copper resistance protein B [Luteimonas sp.]|nr:copper resistance protein B [Luteimonas sp.]